MEYPEWPYLKQANVTDEIYVSTAPCNSMQECRQGSEDRV